MPPADNNTPAPAPQEPKKGFFARLFGGGKKTDASAATVPPTHESQTPSPQLDDVQTDAPSDGSIGGVVPDVSTDAPAEAPTEMLSSVESAPVVESSDAPSAVSSEMPTEVPVDESKPPVGPVPPAQ